MDDFSGLLFLQLLGKDCYDIDIALDNMLGSEFVDKVREYLLTVGEEAQGVAVIPWYENHVSLKLLYALIRSSIEEEIGGILVSRRDNFILIFRVCYAVALFLLHEVIDRTLCLNPMLSVSFWVLLNCFKAIPNFQLYFSSNPDQSKHLETARMRIFDIWIDFVNLRCEEYSENSRIPTKVCSHLLFYAYSLINVHIRILWFKSEISTVLKNYRLEFQQATTWEINALKCQIL